MTNVTIGPVAASDDNVARTNFGWAAAPSSSTSAPPQPTCSSASRIASGISRFSRWAPVLQALVDAFSSACQGRNAQATGETEQARPPHPAGPCVRCSPASLRKSSVPSAITSPNTSRCQPHALIALGKAFSVPGARVPRSTLQDGGDPSLESSATPSIDGPRDLQFEAAAAASPPLRPRGCRAADFNATSWSI